MYATNAGIFELAPVAVITPENEEDVATIAAFCSSYGIPLTPRGAGTSVSDAALGKGIVLDLSRNMNSIISLNTSKGEVVVQPGITIETLNAKLSRYGKTLPIYPFKGLTCTVGGCIAINAGGLLSGRFGRAGDLVLSLRVVMADGTVFDSSTGKPGLPEQLKDAAESENGVVQFNELFAGSEGKLGIITLVRLRIVDTPPETRARVYHFKRFEEAFSASSGGVFDFAMSVVFADALLQSALSYRLKDFSFPRDADASLIVTGTDSQEWPAQEKAGARSVTDVDTGLENLFSAIVDSIHTLSRPVPNGKYTVCVEGFRVGKGGLRSFARMWEQAAAVSRTRFIMFGEALSGTVYFRPFLNLRRVEDREKHRRLLSEAIAEGAGTSGKLFTENGFGLLINSASADTDTLTEASQTTARKLIDPLHILNPSPAMHEEAESLYRAVTSNSPIVEKPMLNWNTPDLVSVAGRGVLEFYEEVEACHGCGECRTLSFMETQCPVYKAVGGEIASPRGRNNILRLISRMSEMPAVTTYSDEYRRTIYDYCVQCKMCVLECPSNVNTPKLMMEARAQYVRKTGVKTIGRASKFFSDYEFYTVIASSVASLMNRLIRSGKARSVLEHSVGIDRRRKIPEFDLQTFTEWFEKHDSMAGRKSDLVYFSDVYANYFDSRVGIATVMLLEGLGYSVLPRSGL